MVERNERGGLNHVTPLTSKTVETSSFALVEIRNGEIWTITARRDASPPREIRNVEFTLASKGNWIQI